MQEENKKIEFWKDGEYVAEGGYFIRCDLKQFMNKLIEDGKEPVGIILDLESFNLEVIVKKKI
jgi:hypothetical protein